MKVNKGHRYGLLSESLPKSEWPEKMKLSQAHKFLGISFTKMSKLISSRIIKYEQDPLDYRVKLVKRSDLENLLRSRVQ